MMDLLEKVMHFIEFIYENYSALEAIYNAELAKLGKCAAISNKGLSAEDLSARLDISDSAWLVDRACVQLNSWT